MAKGKVQVIRKKVPTDWEDALQGFLFLKQAQGLAERTLTDYRKHIPGMVSKLLAYDICSNIPLILSST